jgi:hypothetical protein
MYQDAIADARKLREMAEQRAKNQIIDTITPKIRRLIEAQINEGDDDLVDLLDDELVSPDSDIDPEGSFEDADFDDEDFGAEPAEDMGMEDTSLDIDSDGFSSIEISDDDDFEEESSDEGGDKSVHVNITVENRNRRLRKAAIQLVKELSTTKNPRKIKQLTETLKKIRKALIITENGQNVRMAKNLTVILKESGMRRRKNSWLFEGEDFSMGKDGADFEDVEFDDAGFEDEDGEGEIIDALETLGVDVEMLKDELLDTEDDMDFGKDGEMMGKDGADFEDVEFDDADFDDDLEMEGYMAEGDNMDECNEDDEVVEIDESMLRRALRGSNRSARRSPRSTRSARALRESRARRARMARRRRLAEGEAKSMAGHFGGGKLGKEMFVEVSEEQLLNALAEELGNYGSAFKTGNASKGASSFGGGSVKGDLVKAKAIKEARRARRVAKMNESKARQAQRQARAAKSELKESNLFNTKLIYVTKIMQENTLSKRQQRAIVEAMDNAKTQREAKLLFQSLNESLNKKKLQESRKARTSQRLNENRSSTGSSSTLLRSGQAPRTSTNEVKLDRWAVLAGINK